MCCCGVLSPIFRGGSVHLFSHFLSPICLLSLIFYRSLSKTILLSWFPLAASLPSWGPRPFRLPRPVLTSSRGRVRSEGGAGPHIFRAMCGARPHLRHAPGPRRRSGRDEGGGTGEDPTTGTVQQARTTTTRSSQRVTVECERQKIDRREKIREQTDETSPKNGAKHTTTTHL